jgi:hypothetical protein
VADHVVGLVTLFHPDRFLGCSATALRDYPYAIRYRAERIKRVREAKVPSKIQYLDDHAVIGNGVEAREYHDTVVDGSSIVEFLLDPRLLRIPDEQPGRPKWRMEFRRQWPADDPPLTRATLATLHSTLSQSQLRIRGIWVNPSIDSNWPNANWVNLVFGPCSQEAASRFRIVNLELRRDPVHQVVIALPD